MENGFNENDFSSAWMRGDVSGALSVLGRAAKTGTPERSVFANQMLGEICLSLAQRRRDYNSWIDEGFWSECPPCRPIVAALLAEGADPNFEHGEDSVSLLAFAAYAADPLLVETLLAHGAIPDAHMLNRAAYASCSGYSQEWRDGASKCVDLLLKADPDLHLKREDGPKKHPLIVALRGDDSDACTPSPEAVKSLLSAGADPNTAFWGEFDEGPDRIEGTALNLAVKNERKNGGEGSFEIVKMLVAAGAGVDGLYPKAPSPLSEASLSTMGYLLSKGARIDVRDMDEYGLPLLHAVARKGESDKASLLLAHGADLFHTDRSGNTPLHFAAGSGNMETIRLLKDRGADIDSKNKDGATPFDLSKDETIRDVFRAAIAEREAAALEAEALVAPERGERSRSAARRM